MKHQSFGEALIFVLKALFLHPVIYIMFGFKNQWGGWFLFAGIFECNPYKKVVINAVNKFQCEVVVELGCGLGDIIRRVNGSQRIGIDIDRNIVKAARFLCKRDNIEFIVGSFKELNDLAITKIDCLIMINFLHRLPLDTVKEELNKLLFSKQVSYIVVDEIVPGMMPGFKYYHHDFDLVLNRKNNKYYKYNETLCPTNERRIKVYKFKERVNNDLNLTGVEYVQSDLYQHGTSAGSQRLLPTEPSHKSRRLLN